jgi:hypothetical protein
MFLSICTPAIDFVIIVTIDIKLAPKILLVGLKHLNHCSFINTPYYVSSPSRLALKHTKLCRRKGTWAWPFERETCVNRSSYRSLAVVWLGGGRADKVLVERHLNKGQNVELAVVGAEGERQVNGCWLTSTNRQSSIFNSIVVHMLMSSAGP